MSLFSLKACCFDFHLLLYYLYVRVFHYPFRSSNTSLRILSNPASLYSIFLAAGSKRLNIYFSMYFIIPMSLHDPFIIAGGQIWGLAQIMLLTAYTVYSLLSEMLLLLLTLLDCCCSLQVCLKPPVTAFYHFSQIKVSLL